MSRDKTKWVSQMISTKTRKMLDEFIEVRGKIKV